MVIQGGHHSAVVLKSGRHNLLELGVNGMIIEPPTRQLCDKGLLVCCVDSNAKVLSFSPCKTGVLINTVNQSDKVR